MRLFDLPKIAASLGADVPVCFTNRPAFVTGTGVHVRVSNDPLPHVPLVLVNPGVPLSTPAVFKALNAGPAKPRTPGEPKLPRGPFADVADLARQLGQTRNDLEPPAVRLVPRIAEVLAALRGEPGCLLARLSGSGPTCFALCQSDRAAETIANHLAATHPYWWVKATRLRC